MHNSSKSICFSKLNKCTQQPALIYSIKLTQQIHKLKLKYHF